MMSTFEVGLVIWGCFLIVVLIAVLAAYSE